MAELFPGHERQALIRARLQREFAAAEAAKLARGPQGIPTTLPLDMTRVRAEDAARYGLTERLPPIPSAGRGAHAKLLEDAVIRPYQAESRMVPNEGLRRTAKDAIHEEARLARTPAGRMDRAASTIASGWRRVAPIAGQMAMTAAKSVLAGAAAEAVFAHDEGYLTERNRRLAAERSDMLYEERVALVAANNRAKAEKQARDQQRDKGRSIGGVKPSHNWGKWNAERKQGLHQRK